MFQKSLSEFPTNTWLRSRKFEADAEFGRYSKQPLAFDQPNGQWLKYTSRPHVELNILLRASMSYLGCRRVKLNELSK